MKILSIDTSSKNCSISITEVTDNNFKIIAEKNSNDEKTHSQKLMPMISEMFLESNLNLGNIDLLACTLGPGSFTGIRIGVATIKAFADAKNIPVVGITSLESLAYNVCDNGYIIPIINAKNNNAYSAMFSHNDSKYLIEFENFADNIEVMIDKFVSYLNNNKTNNDVYFVGDGAINFKDIILEKFNNYNILFSDKNEQSSISLAKCAYEKYKLGYFGDSNSISPVYLRQSQAERNLILK